MFVSITRLRLRTLWYLPAFAAHALRSVLQAKAAAGNISTTLLAEADRTFWTRTVWADERAMRAFMRSGPHGRVMGRLADWCDEASVVHWTADATEVPSWEDAQQRMQGQGRPSRVNHPTPAHRNFHIAPMRRGRFRELRIK